MLLKPLHPFGEMESTFEFIKKIGLFFIMGLGHIGAGYYLIFSRYANFSFFMLLKPLHPFHEMESTFGIIKKGFFCMEAGHI
jgi:hypothetical protein